MSDDINTFYANWPDCAVEGCPNKCCLALDSVWCFPHTPGNEHVKRMKIDAASADPLQSEAEFETSAWQQVTK